MAEDMGTSVPIPRKKHKFGKPLYVAGAGQHSAANSHRAWRPRLHRWSPLTLIGMPSGCPLRDGWWLTEHHGIRNRMGNCTPGVNMWIMDKEAGSENHTHVADFDGKHMHVVAWV